MWAPSSTLEGALALSASADLSHMARSGSRPADDQSHHERTSEASETRGPFLLVPRPSSKHQVRRSRRGGLTRCEDALHLRICGALARLLHAGLEGLDDLEKLPDCVADLMRPDSEVAEHRAQSQKLLSAGGCRG